MTIPAETEEKKEPFPWHLGVYDAHCHPTDTMSLTTTIPTMKTRCLTVMATRSQDQNLVSRISDSYTVKSSNPEEWGEKECIVPAFGWHPWFSHQMYIDDGCEAAVKGEAEDIETEQPPQPLSGDDKIKHYHSVLRPQRPFSDLSEADIRIFESLPDPTPFSTFLSSTRKHLENYPYALIGEIGLDRSFRIPESWVLSSDEYAARDQGLTLGGREGRRLTPFRVDLEHQKQIVRLQLKLAASMNRAVSMHGVQAHGVVFDVLRESWKGHERKVLSKREKKKLPPPGSEPAPDADKNEQDGGDEQPKPTPYPPRVCLHSYSGNPSTFTQYLSPTIPTSIFASFSTAINLSDDLEGETPKSFEDMVRAVPDHMLLVESDLHTAGERMDIRIEDIVQRICKIKGWSLEDGVRILGRNWRRFVFGMEE